MFVEKCKIKLSANLESGKERGPLTAMLHQNNGLRDSPLRYWQLDLGKYSPPENQYPTHHVSS